MEYKYDAFISYRHKIFDKAVAIKLQKLLESYKPPKNINYKNTNKINRVFRDESELPTSGDLSGDIKNALEQSRYLIVVFSEDTMDSRWCMEEIRYFKEIHGGNTDKILTLLINGEPENVFPKELRFENKNKTTLTGENIQIVEEIEPLAANICSKKTSQSLRKLNVEFLRLASPILGCGFDDLYQRHRRRKVFKLTSVISVSVLTLFLLTIYYTYTTSVINMQILYNQLDIAYEYIEDNEKITSNSILSYINENNFNIDKIFEDTLKELMEQSSYIPKFSEYGNYNFNNQINYTEFSENGDQIFVATENNTIYILDSNTCQLVSEIKTNNEIIQFSLFDNLLYGITRDGTVEIWDIETLSLNEEFILGNKDGTVDFYYYDLLSHHFFGNELIIQDTITVTYFNLETGEMIYLNDLENADSVLFQTYVQGLYYNDADKKVIMVHTYDVVRVFDLKTQDIERYYCGDDFNPYFTKYLEKSNEVISLKRNYENSKMQIIIDKINIDTGEEKIFYIANYDLIFDENETMNSRLSPDLQYLISLPDENGTIEVLDIFFEDHLYEINIGYEGSISYITENLVLIKAYSDNIENCKLLFVNNDYNGIYTSSTEDDYIVEDYSAITYELENSKFLYDTKINSQESVLVWWDIYGTIHFINMEDDKYIVQSSLEVKDLTYFDSEPDKYMENSDDFIGQGEKSEVIARTSNGEYEVVSILSAKIPFTGDILVPPDYLVTEGNGYVQSLWLASSKDNQILYNINIPYSNIKAIDIKDDETAYVYTKANSVVTINMETGEILNTVKLDEFSDFYLDSFYWNIYTTDNDINFRFEVDAEKSLVFMSYYSSDLVAKLYSLDSGKLIYDFSPSFSEKAIFISSDFETVYFHDKVTDDINEFQIPNFEELIDKVDNLSQDRNLSDKELDELNK